MALRPNHFAGGAHLTGAGASCLAAILNGKIDRAALDSVTPLASPGTASASDIATKLNALITALKTAS